MKGAAYTFICLFILCGIPLVVAENLPAEAGVDPIQSLPAAQDENPAPLMIGKGNCAEFKGVIVPELYQSVREGSFELAAFRGARCALELDQIWRGGSADARATLLDTKSIVFPDDLAAGFIFGGVDVLDALEDRSDISYRVLWNLATTPLSERFTSTQFSIQHFKAAEQLVEVYGEITRIYPRTAVEGDKTAQLFREKIQFTNPSVLKGLGWLTFRFLGSDEDVVWVASPALKKTRQLTGSNRSDPFLKTVVSADDLYGWSGKVEMVEASRAQSQTALVPIAQLDCLRAAPRADGCFVAESTVAQRTQASGAIRSLADVYSGAARFAFPEGVFFVPRSVWRIELSPKDPFSLYGRQVLYVDRELMLPFIKIVYNRSGERWKTVMTAFQKVETTVGARSVFIPRHTIVEDAQRGEYSLVSYNQSAFCGVAPSVPPLSLFDPKNLGETALPVPAPPVVATPRAVDAAPSVIDPTNLDD